MAASDASAVVAEGDVLVESSRAPGRSAGAQARYLVHPFVDFLCLGGASLVIVPALALLLASESAPAAATVAALLSIVINHPHFAHSYQIFYGNFRRKAFGHEYPPLLRLRYIVAGIVVPVALFVFFAFCLLADPSLLGAGASGMFFLVGWHYAKQGYGMIILDSVLKRRFFSEPEKKVLLMNAFACWVCSWVVASSAAPEREYWGLKYYAVPLPRVVVVAVIGIAVFTTMRTLLMLTRKALVHGGGLPVNGVAAYIATLYLWLVFVRAFGPIALLVVPAFHSLQYLVVVWRYRFNSEESRARADRRPGLGALSRPRWRLARFFAAGVVLGFLGFWAVPAFSDALVPYDHGMFGPTLSFFLFWIFINVHHYFLDNVMWRRDNPEVRQHLFA